MQPSPGATAKLDFWMPNRHFWGPRPSKKRALHPEVSFREVTARFGWNLMPFGLLWTLLTLLTVFDSTQDSGPFLMRKEYVYLEYATTNFVYCEF